jgi:hypothetical protein
VPCPINNVALVRQLPDQLAVFKAVRSALALATSIQHSALRVAGFENEDDDDDSLPDEACGPMITPVEKSASQARRAPKIGERSRENEARGERLQPATRVQFLEGASNRVDTPFLQATTFEHEHEREAPGERLQPRGREVQFGQDAILRYSSTPTLRSQGIEDENENEALVRIRSVPYPNQVGLWIVPSKWVLILYNS